MCHDQNIEETVFHDQQNLTRILLIIITSEMIDKISSMPDGKY
jgi:hypothetical protein